jgi:hypothetical protein
MEAFNRHRSRGKQQIVVQHIHITADKAAVAVGGQPGGWAGLFFAAETGSPRTASSASQSGLRGSVSRSVKSSGISAG